MGNFTATGTTTRLKKITLVKEYPTIYLHLICRYCGVITSKEFDPIYPEKIYMQPGYCGGCHCNSVYVMVTSLPASKLQSDRWGFYD